MALMTSLPYVLLCTCALLCVWSVTSSKMCLECEEPEWIINWDKKTQPSFYPSQTSSITPSMDIDDIWQSIGRIWRADNILESLGFMCLRYGPEVNNATGFSMLPLFCNPIVDALRNGQHLNISNMYDDFTPKFPVLDYEINYFHLLEACDVAGRCGNCSLQEKLDFIGDCATEGGFYLFRFVYNLAQRWAPLVFDLLQWLGPSRINLLDTFHTCSALRYIIGMRTSVLSQNIINVATYLGAEYIQHLFINSSCSLIDVNYPSFDSYNVRVLQSAYNAKGRSFCSEIEGAESIEEFRNITKVAIEILVEVLTSTNYCKNVLFHEMSPLNESMIELICDWLDVTYLAFRAYPDNMGSPSIWIVLDMLRDILRMNSVYGVAMTVCHTSLMDPYLTNGNMGELCRALLSGGSEKLEDVCIQQKAFFNEFIYDFLDLDKPIGPSRNLEVRPIEETDVVFLVIEWARVLFNLQDLSLATILDVADSLFHRQNIKTMFNAAIDVILDGHFVMAIETMCRDFSDFREGVEKYLSVQNFPYVILDQDSKQMADLFTEVFPLFLGVENSDILCDNTSANIGYGGRPFPEYIEEIRMNIVNLLTRKDDCIYFMESLDEALSNAFNTTEDSLKSVLQTSTGFSDYKRMCTTVTFYLEPICYDFTVKMQPARAKSEKIMIDLNFPYCYGSYWTYEREQFTGTGRTLPEVDLTIPAPSPAFKFLDILPGSRDPLDHVGVYVHSFRSNFHNEEVSVHSVIQSNGILTFEIPTQTAYIGDNTTIRIAEPDKYRRRRLSWRKNGRLIAQGRGKNQLQLWNVNLADAGIYEVYVSGRRSKGYHGILRLIVPDCPRYYFNAPSCNKVSFVSCYNGGVLRTDTSDKQCICAYPFGGQFCHEVALPVNPGDELPLDYCFGIKCKGVMFCRRDPFGCKCASGYTGKGCKKVCPQGRYGPSCEGTCHCQGDCDPVSGQCDVMCEVGMTGWNCQFPSA